MTSDNVNHPPHYLNDPSGVECITIVRHRTFNIGAVIKYCWRGGRKVADGAASAHILEDYNKALWHLCDEIQRLGGDVTCRHVALLKARMVDDEDAASTVIVAPPAHGKTTEPAPHEIYSLPEWVRLEDWTDGEAEFCSACRCTWWTRVNANVVKCARCGMNNINLKGGSFKIVAREVDKPEL